MCLNGDTACAELWRHRGQGLAAGVVEEQRLLLEEAALELDGYVVVSAQEGGRERREGHSQRNR